MSVEVIEAIRKYHRQQRFIVKMQSRIDRSMEAFIRVNVFGFSPDMEEDERKEIVKKTMSLIKQCRAGNASAEYLDVADMIIESDKSRRSWDKLRAQRERALEKLAKAIPAVASMKKKALGVGYLGMAQIIGEAGDLSNYANPGKLWKRLGLAPYQGFAMSSWMRAPSKDFKGWVPRKLTSAEWIANPFKPERYAIISQIAQWLWVKQWIGKEKAPPDGIPAGNYGEIYRDRRRHTAQTHPEWTPMHSHRDALRYMNKRFTRNFWSEWRRASAEVTEKSIVHLSVASISRRYPKGGYEMPA